MSDVRLIWAQASNGVIGRDGAMPWHVPEDLAHFRELTIGSPVVMGRKTWDALVPRFKPLPDRRNIVITRRDDWAEPGAEVAHSTHQAIALAGDGTVWIIGGAEVYAAFIDDADILEVTELSAAYDGDAVAPTIDSSWSVTSTEPAVGWFTSRTGIEYRFLRYAR